jgi:hypothetical protein
MKKSSSYNFRKYQILFILLITSFSACKSLSPTSNPGPNPVPPQAISSVNVPLEIPKATLDKIINSQIPKVLFEEKELDMGSGINGDLKLTRNGMITWTALDSQLIQLTVPVLVEGQVGLKKGGLGSLFKSKIPINEQFKPVFVVDPEINSNWDVGIKALELVDLGGAISLDILGMQVDLSGLVAKEIRKWSTENLLGNESLVSLKPLVDLTWAQVGKPFQVELEGVATAFSIQPEEVRFREFFDSNQNFNVWLGLAGKVNSHPATAAPSRAFPLPKLSVNPNDSNELEIIMPLTVGYDVLDQLLADNLADKVFRVDKKTTMIPSNIKTQSFGELVAVSMDFFAEQSNGKSLEGSIFAVGKPAYDIENRQLIFEDLNFKIESGNLGAQTSIGLKKRKIIKNIERRAIFPIGDLIDESMGSIQNRLGLSTPIADLKIQNLKVIPAGFYPLRNELLIQLKATGKVGVDWK